MAWDESLDDWPRALASFRLRPGRTALLVIDVQRYCADPAIGLAAEVAARHEGYAAYAFPRLRDTVLPNIRALLEHFRSRGERVIFFTVGPQCPDGADYRLSRRVADLDRQASRGTPTIFPVGSPGHAIMDDVAPRPGEIVINKRTSSAFASTGIDHLLRGLGITDLVCTGMTTEACVESTARSAADRGYNVLLVDDACQTWERSAHDATLRTFARNFGRVSTAAGVVAELSGVRLD
jgi:nicotinamidase-related amidase